MFLFKYGIFATKLLSVAFAIDHRPDITPADRQLVSVSGIYETRADLKGPRCPAGLEVPESECLAAGRELGGLGGASEKSLVTLVNKGDNALMLLGLCDGDCNGDRDCETGLECFHRGISEVPGCTGIGNIPQNQDFCVEPALKARMWTLCEGGCSSDNDCGEDMVCQQGTIDSFSSVPGCFGTPEPDMNYCVALTSLQTTCGCSLWNTEIRYTPCTDESTSDSSVDLTGLVCKKGPWAIDFKNATTNFTPSSEDELIIMYHVSRNRNVNVPVLLKGDCKSKIADTALVSSSNETTIESSDLTRKILVVKHNFNKTAIGGSNIYNATSKELKVCQIVQLISDNGEMTIVEDQREIVVKFDLAYNYTISNTALSAAIIEDEKKEVNVNSYIKACKCNSEGDTCDPDNNATPLKPNDELHVCIYSTSADVGIDRLESMTVEQTVGGEKESDGSNYSFDFIKDDVVVVPSITGREYRTPTMIGLGPGVMVSARLPLDKFVFSADSRIAIKGKIVMDFVGTAGRKLQATGADTVVTGTEAASFDLVVALQPNIEAEYPVVSTGMFVNRGLSRLTLVFAWAYMMW